MFVYMLSCGVESVWFHTSWPVWTGSGENSQIIHKRSFEVFESDIFFKIRHFSHRMSLIVWRKRKVCIESNDEMVMLSHKHCSQFQLTIHTRTDRVRAYGRTLLFFVNQIHGQFLDNNNCITKEMPTLMDGLRLTAKTGSVHTHGVR